MRINVSKKVYPGLGELEVVEYTEGVKTKKLMGLEMPGYFLGIQESDENCRLHIHRKSVDTLQDQKKFYSLMGLIKERYPEQVPEGRYADYVVDGLGYQHDEVSVRIQDDRRFAPFVEGHLPFTDTLLRDPMRVFDLILGWDKSRIQAETEFNLEEYKKIRGYEGKYIELYSDIVNSSGYLPGLTVRVALPDIQDVGEFVYRLAGSPEYLPMPEKRLKAPITDPWKVEIPIIEDGLRGQNV